MTEQKQLVPMSDAAPVPASDTIRQAFPAVRAAAQMDSTILAY